MARARKNPSTAFDTGLVEPGRVSLESVIMRVPRKPLNGSIREAQINKDGAVLRSSSYFPRRTLEFLTMEVNRKNLDKDMSATFWIEQYDAATETWSRIHPKHLKPKDFPR